MTTPASHPEFATAEQCRAWLAKVPLTNAPLAQAEILRQLNLLNLHALPAAERIGILELLRKPILNTQKEIVRRFSGRALPLAPPEYASYEGSQALWQALLVGYRHCLLATLAENSSEHAALPLARALATLADSLIDSCRAGYQPTREFWRTLHDLYGTAERLGITELEVSDVLRAGRGNFPLRSAYVESLLLHLASPYELPLRQLNWLASWARRWSMKVTISATAPQGEPKSTPFFVDLATYSPASYSPGQGAGVRHFDTTGLRMSLKKRINLLDTGAEPVTLQLGSDCVQPACGILLKQTYQRWCKGGIRRNHERQTSTGKCEIIVGIEAVHYLVSGRKPFSQPGHASDETLRREREEIATFGRIQSRAPADYSQQRGYQSEEWRVVEEWQMHNESANGLHLSQPLDATKVRVAQGQLIAVRPADAQSPLLGLVRWAMVGMDSSLHAGLMIIPGRPDAISVTASDIDTGNDPYRRGFLLPAVPALGVPASIVIPSGWFKSERRIEVYTDGARHVRLTELLDRGSDFDRAGYLDVPD